MSSLCHGAGSPSSRHEENDTRLDGLYKAVDYQHFFSVKMYEQVVQQKGKVVIAVSRRGVFSKLLKRKADAFLFFDDKSNDRMKPYLYRNFVK